MALVSLERRKSKDVVRDSSTAGAEERLAWQLRLFGVINQVEKEPVRRIGSLFETFVHVQFVGQVTTTLTIRFPMAATELTDADFDGF